LLAFLSEAGKASVELFHHKHQHRRRQKKKEGKENERVSGNPFDLSFSDHGFLLADCLLMELMGPLSSPDIQ